MSNITLHGFNNLTKSLSFSLYKLHYLNSNKAHTDYTAYINEHFCADRLNTILVNICHTIGGNILNIAKQDYQPQGASVTLMISEEAQPSSCTEILVAHLDKSHICIHTYPEETPQDGVAIFRADIELSTCGVISPLKVLNFVIKEFNADVIDIDYRVRGMTRNLQGGMLFEDQKVNNICDHINSDILEQYKTSSHNFLTQNLFHTKLSKKTIKLDEYLFNIPNGVLLSKQHTKISLQIQNHIDKLYQARISSS